MWNLAFSFTITHRVAAFKAYYAIRSFITYNGIFMGPGYDLGDGSVWRKVAKLDDERGPDEEDEDFYAKEELGLILHSPCNPLSLSNIYT